MWQIVWTVDNDVLPVDDEYFYTYQEAHNAAQNDLDFAMENIEEVRKMTGMPKGVIPGFHLVRHQVH
jgi:hypothetical protein